VGDDLAADHEKVAGGLARAQEIGVVDEVVEPGATRTALAKALSGPVTRGEHTNIPL
jgi:acetyl-CoA/propionyl-CoA carboxylase carboxyl transferase subunit